MGSGNLHESMTIMIDMTLIWPRYGWDVDPLMVARKLNIQWTYYYSHTNINQFYFGGITSKPDMLPEYAHVINEHIDSDDVINYL